MEKYQIVKIEDNRNIIINGGAKDGILQNQQFLVYSLDGEELIDPKTKMSLGRIETVKGTGIVTFLEEKWCRITSDMPKKYNPFDFTHVSTVDKVVDPNWKEPNTNPFRSLSLNDIVKNT